MSLLNPWVLLGLLAAALAIAVSSEQFGENRQENADKAKLLAEERKTSAERDKRYEAVAQLVVDQGKRDAAAALELEQAHARVIVVTKFIREKVPAYVTPLADSRCIVPVGFVQLFNAAASGQADQADTSAPATTGGLSVDRPSGVALSAVGTRTVDNFGTCHELETQVAGWKKYGHEVDAWSVKVNAIFSEGARAAPPGG